MARTSKTTIGGEGQSNDRMMRAAESGAAAKAQAHGNLLSQYRSGAELANQTARDVGNTLHQAAAQEQQQSQFDRTMQQRESELDLEGAKAGFERGGGEGDARSAQLEAEMQRGQGQPQIGPLEPEAQQRLQEQGKQKLEMDASGRWRPTQERKDAQARTQTREDFQADTERIRALAYRDQVGVAAQKALVSGDTEAYEGYAKQLAATPNAMQKTYDRLMSNDVNSNDWGELEKLAQGGPDSDTSLMADLKAKQFTPRVASFVRAQVSKDALQAIVLSKGDTSRLQVDWTAPKMREFTQEVTNINDFMRNNPALGQLAFIKSTEDKMRFLNTLAASKVLMNMTQAPAPAAGMMPATEAPPEGGAPQPQDPMVPPGGTQVPGREAGASAVQQARAGGASPSEALQAGQQKNPTARFGDSLMSRPSIQETRRAGL